MTSIRPRFEPFYHISIPLHQISNRQRSFGMLGNDLFKDGDFLRDHPQISLHPRNIPAHVAGVNWEKSL